MEDSAKSESVTERKSWGCRKQRGEEGSCLMASFNHNDIVAMVATILDLACTEHIIHRRIVRRNCKKIELNRIHKAVALGTISKIMNVKPSITVLSDSTEMFGTEDLSICKNHP